MTDTQASGREGADSAKSGKSASSGNIRQRLRLWTGLILFAFCLTHFLNHALGIVSLEAMEAGRQIHEAIWGNDLGQLVFFCALLIHMGLALWRTARRRTLKMPKWEFLQLVLGLYIPWTLIPHGLATAGLDGRFGVEPSYERVLSLIWPEGAFMQTVLLGVVWLHAVIGLHFWLRLRKPYQRLFPALLSLAALVPFLAAWGWIESARRLAATGKPRAELSPEAGMWLYTLADQSRAVVFGLAAAALLVIAIRAAFRTFTPKIEVRYPGNTVLKVAPGPSILEMSRMNNIPHAAVCGGRARCSTCRVLVLNGDADEEHITPAEKSVLQRIGAEGQVRLACQYRPQSSLTVRPLVPFRQTAGENGNISDAYHWGVEQSVVIMFVDLRNFTSITENQLSYDVVFLLNRYLGDVSGAIRAEGGHVDKFIGDGIMAIFGINSSTANAARQALNACRRIGEVLETLNAERGPQFEKPFRLGIGLHAGPAILGRIGAAGGDARTEAPITALGDVVNTASRLETANKEFDSMLVASEAVLSAAGLDIEGAEWHELAVRGKSRPLKVAALKELADLVLLDGRTSMQKESA